MARCGKQTDRVPAVGYLQQEIPSFASAAVLMYGISIPSAPQSSACWMPARSWYPPTRTIDLALPEWMAKIMCDSLVRGREKG